MITASSERLGLRERKKRRTRQTIVDVAVRLFTDQGYEETTLVQVAETAEIAPSTFFNYFPSKVDIVFGFFDAVIESARERVLGRPDGESTSAALLAWLREDMPEIEAGYAEGMRRLPEIIMANAALRSEQLLRSAQLEDVFAEGYARDLGEPADSLRPRVMATIALRGMADVWAIWYAQHAHDADFDPRASLAAKATYLEPLLAAGLDAVELLPRPTAVA